MIDLMATTEKDTRQNSLSTPEKLISDVKKMRILAILLTVLQVSMIVISLAFTNFWIKFAIDNYGNLYVLGIDLIISMIFVWFTWKKMPFERKVKTNNSFLIFFFGFVGLWLCTPNQRELHKLIEDNFGEYCQENSN